MYGLQRAALVLAAAADDGRFSRLLRVGSPPTRNKRFQPARAASTAVQEQVLRFRPRYSLAKLAEIACCAWEANPRTTSEKNGRCWLRQQGKVLLSAAHTQTCYLTC